MANTNPFRRRVGGEQNNENKVEEQQPKVEESPKIEEPPKRAEPPKIEEPPRETIPTPPPVQPAQPRENNSEDEEKTNSGMIVKIAIGILLLLIAGIVVLLLSKDSVPQTEKLPVEKPVKLVEPVEQEPKPVIKKAEPVEEKIVDVLPPVADKLIEKRSVGQLNVNLDNFSFISKYGVDFDSLIECDGSKRVSGFSGLAQVKIQNGEFAIGENGWQKTDSTIKNGDTIKIRHFSSPNPNTITKTILIIGGNEIYFQSTSKK